MPLAHGTVVGGFKIIDGRLSSLYEAIIAHCQGADFWNADETSWRVFEADKKQWWLWLVASDDAVVYLLDPSRSQQVPQAFFTGSSGTLMTDRLAAYKSLVESVKKAWCWIHVRRDFFNLFLGVPKVKWWAESWLREIAHLFMLENRRFDLWRQGKRNGREWLAAQRALEAHVEHLKERWKSELRLPNLHQVQKKVLRSLKRHWEGLTLFLSDPRIPLHNNRAERLIRTAVVLGKGSYGSGSQWAGDMSAKVLTVFQTWLINGLDPEALLLDFFDECSKTPGHPPMDLDQYLPWKMTLERKLAFALPEGFKTPG